MLAIKQKLRLDFWTIVWQRENWQSNSIQNGGHSVGSRFQSQFFASTATWCTALLLQPPGFLSITLFLAWRWLCPRTVINRFVQRTVACLVCLLDRATAISAPLALQPSYLSH